MVPYYHARASAEVLGAGDYFEADVGGVAHCPFEGAGGGVLAHSVVAEAAEEERGEDSIEGAEY